jgi:hypothetical protein
MKKEAPETMAKCYECGKPFPEGELTYNTYFHLWLCNACNRKLNFYKDFHTIRLCLEIVFWAWVFTTAIPLLFILVLLLTPR